MKQVTIELEMLKRSFLYFKYLHRMRWVFLVKSFCIFFSQAQNEMQTTGHIGFGIACKNVREMGK